MSHPRIASVRSISASTSGSLRGGQRPQLLVGRRPLVGGGQQNVDLIEGEPCLLRRIDDPESLHGAGGVATLATGPLRRRQKTRRS
jgi:hypothetical protein